MRIDWKKFNVQTLTVTPKLAEEWLARNTRNRKLKDRKINIWAGAMKRGEWMLNGATICFDWNGVLLDGQNRLHAVIKSGQDIESIVVFGLDPESQKTMDLNVGRSYSDALQISGKQNATTLSSSLGFLHRYLLGKESQHQTGQATFAQLDELYELNPEIEDSIPIGHKLYREVGMSRHIGTAFHYVVTRIDDVLAKSFFDGLITGAELPVGSPILTLRNWLIRNARDTGRNEKAPAYLQWAMAAKAWNAHRRGRSLSNLRWLESEPFPRPE